MLGYPPIRPPPPRGTQRLTGRPTYPPSRPPKVFAPGWGSIFEQATPFVQNLSLDWVGGRQEMRPWWLMSWSTNSKTQKLVSTFACT